MYTLDYETRQSLARPNYPPEPVGLSAKKNNQKSYYTAWGHPSGNNCDHKGYAYAALQAAWDGEMIFHNAKFDLAVANERHNMPLPSWDRVHDTMILIFLHDPNTRFAGLKPYAEKLLGLPPEEKDAVAQWLWENKVITKSQLTKAGAYISQAPGDVVAPYANGDVDRTKAIFDILHPKVLEAGMGEAYDRERRLLPLLLRNEQQGIRVDTQRLEKDVRFYRWWMEKIDGYLHRRLKNKDINLDADQQLMGALIAADEVIVKKLKRTKDGGWSAAAENLLPAMKDPILWRLLKYRGQLGTYLKTFMEPWLTMAQESGGLIFTDWNQIKGEKYGARTGRLSSSPNFQNIPVREFDYFTPPHNIRTLLRGIPELPVVRSYVIPMRKDHILIDRDVSQQEIRILAHFENGVLEAGYHQDPWLDAHDHARDKIHEILGILYDRKPVKNTNFGLIYGMGLDKLAAKNGTSKSDARDLKKAIMTIFPGLNDLYDDMRARADAGEPFKTWGGRVYYCEEPFIYKGRIIKLDYKMLNTLIQGSAADHTKQSIINYHEVKHEDDLFYLTVHDQFLCSVPKKRLKDGMKRLQTAIEDVKFSVPMLSEGRWSPTDWASLKDYDKRGKLCV